MKGARTKEANLLERAHRAMDFRGNGSPSGYFKQNAGIKDK